MIIKVKVHPNSKEIKVCTNSDGIFQVYIRQRPVKWRANKELLVVLAEYFDISPNKIFLMSGNKSKMKIFEIKSS